MPLHDKRFSMMEPTRPHHKDKRCSMLDVPSQHQEKRQSIMESRRSVCGPVVTPVKIDLLDIEYDNPTGVFYSGSTLKGKVVITLEEPVVMRALRLRIVGRAHTSWPDDGWQVGPGGVTERVCCNAEEQYFDTLMTLFGHPPGKLGSETERQATLDEGSHSFPFRFNLPTSCPTSFEGEYGNIRYLCKAIVDIPWKMDHTAKRAFTIIRPYDLNSPPPPVVTTTAVTTLGSSAADIAAVHPNEPASNEASQLVQTGCCCKSGGEIQLKASLEKSGFVPGEHIPIWANIINNCGSALKQVRVVLLQRARYRSKYRGSIRERSSYRKVAEVYTKEELPSRWALVWDKETIHVPPLPPPIDNCGLIKLDYGLVYNAGSVTVALPLCIGTVPLKSAIATLRKQCQTDFLDKIDPNRLPVDLLPLPDDVQKYSGMPPPCYALDSFGEVSIRERADNEYVRGQLDYAPRYPYYKWPPKEFSFTEDVDKLSVSVFM